MDEELEFASVQMAVGHVELNVEHEMASEER